MENSNAPAKRLLFLMMSERSNGNRNYIEEVGLRVTSLRTNPVYENRRQSRISASTAPKPTPLVDSGIPKGIQDMLQDLKRQSPTGGSVRHNGRRLGSNW